MARPDLIPPPWERAEESARALLASAGKPDAEVSVLLTDDPGIRILNRDWRNLDKPTDVLSWPLEEEPNPDGAEFLGDVAISLDTAARQAEARGWDIAEETALLLVHGILHLLGHEDETEAGAEEMKRIETSILGRPLDKVESVGGKALPASGVQYPV